MLHCAFFFFATFRIFCHILEYFITPKSYITSTIMRKKVSISCRNNYLAKERLSPLIAGFSKTETIVNQSIYKKIPLTS